MPSPIDKARASRPAARCGHCKKDKPRDAFFPSVFWRYEEPLCRDCQRERDAKKRAEGHQSTVDRLREVFAGRDTWTAIEAADLIGYKRHTVGSLLETLRQQGFVERVKTGVYRFPIVQPSPAAAPPPAPPAEYVPVPRPPAPPAHNGPLFIQAGPYLICAQNIACAEYDDRGRVSVMLNVQETRPNGHMAPVTYEFDGEDAARFLADISLLRGVPPVELTERISKLERELKKAREDLSAALALVEEAQINANDPAYLANRLNALMSKKAA